MHHATGAAPQEVVDAPSNNLILKPLASEIGTAAVTVAKHWALAHASDNGPATEADKCAGRRCTNKQLMGIFRLSMLSSIEAHQ